MKTNPSVQQPHCAAANRSHPYQRPLPDFLIHGSGTLYLFEPLTQTAQAWLEAHCPAGRDHQYLGRNLAIECRYVADIIQFATRDGLTGGVR